MPRRPGEPRCNRGSCGLRQVAVLRRTQFLLRVPVETRHGNDVGTPMSRTHPDHRPLLGRTLAPPRRCPTFAQLPVQSGRRQLVPLRRLAVALRPSRPRPHQKPIPQRAAAGTTRVDLHADTTRVVGGLLVAWSQGASAKGRNFGFRNVCFPRS